MLARHLSSLALPHRERGVLQRVQRLRAHAPQGVQRALLERVHALVGHRECLRDALDDDRWAWFAHAVRVLPNTRMSSNKSATIRGRTADAWCSSAFSRPRTRTRS